MVAQVYQMIVSLIIGVICARYLGPSNYGTISLGASYIAFFTIISAFGLDSIVIKDIIKHRKIEGKLLGTSIGIRIIIGLLSIITVMIVIMLFNPNDTILLTVTCLQSLVLFFNAFHIIEVWYQSHLNSKIPAIVKCIAYTVMSLYKILILLNNKSVEWFAFSTSLDSLLIAVLLCYYYKKDSNRRLQFNKYLVTSLVNKSYHLVIAYIMVAIYCQMDRIMIGKMVDQYSVGIYSAAATICHLWLFIPQAVTNSASPMIIELHNKDNILFIKRLKQLIMVVIAIGLLFIGTIILFKELIVSLLFGTEYAAAIDVIPYLALGTFFSSISYPRSIWLICKNFQKYNKYIVLCGVFTNLILNIILIQYIGIKGAAIATVVTEAVTCFVAPLFIKDIRVFVGYIFASIRIR